MAKEAWPAIPYPPWRETCSALHLWSQIVGKYRLAHTPWMNHSWHATFYVTPRGLTTGSIPDGEHTVAVDFDFCEHRLVVRSDCAISDFALRAMSTADFLRKTKDALAAVGGTPSLHGIPNEIPDPIPFAKDRELRPYDAQAVARYHAALRRIARVFDLFRTSYVGKVSPARLDTTRRSANSSSPTRRCAPPAIRRAPCSASYARPTRRPRAAAAGPARSSSASSAARSCRARSRLHREVEPRLC